MQTRVRQIQLKLRKVNELIIELKVKYLDENRVYSWIFDLMNHLLELKTNFLNLEQIHTEKLFHINLIIFVFR